MPTAELVEHEEHREPTTPEELPPLAREILRVLTAANGLWMSGEEICREIGDQTDPSSGTWKRATKLLRRAGLIETSKTNGYRSAGP